MVLKTGGALDMADSVAFTLPCEVELVSATLRVPATFDQYGCTS